jgi:MFS transporter, DHA2 family, multidrug resistance protein
MPGSTPLHKIRRKIRKRDSAFHPQHSSYRWWVLGNVMIGTFMAVLDATIVNVGLPKIMASFGVGIDRIEWVLTAYMLALAVMLPTAGWLADRFGFKRMYFMGMLLFTIGSFLCGLSPDENFLIISRVIQGLGAGMIMPIGMAIVTREFPPEQRGLALGFWSIAAAASVSFGPLIGGYLVDKFNWQLIFDVNIPIGIIGMLVTVIIQQEYINKNVRKFDLIGFISVAIFLPLILYALSEGNAATNSAGWSAPYILVCFAIAIIALAVFLTNELIVEEPLIDLRLLGNRNFGISSIIMFVFGIGMFGSTFLLPLYLQNSLGYTAIQAGSVFLPVGIIQGAIAPLSGLFGDKTNAKIPIVIGVIILSLSFYMNTFLSYMTEHSYIMTCLYLRGLGMGILFSPLSALTLLEIPREKMAQASGLFNVIRQLGGSFGVAILATMLSSRIKFHSQLFSESLNASSPEFKQVTSQIALQIQHHSGSNLATAIKQGQYMLLSHINKQAYIEAVNDDFMLASIITLVGIIPLIWIHSRKKRQQLKNNAIEYQND